MRTSFSTLALPCWHLVQAIVAVCSGTRTCSSQWQWKFRTCMRCRWQVQHTIASCVLTRKFHALNVACCCGSALKQPSGHAYLPHSYESGNIVTNWLDSLYFWALRLVLVTPRFWLSKIIFCDDLEPFWRELVSWLAVFAAFVAWSASILAWSGLVFG